jgi:hypothetical protein
VLLVFFQALGMEVQRYRNVCCALTDKETVAGLIIYSLCKNIAMEYSHVQKLRYGIRHTVKEKRKKGVTPAVVRNKN